MSNSESQNTDLSGAYFNKPQKMDLSGVFYIQQQYLADLSAISGSVSTSDYYKDLQDKLSTSYSYFKDANTSSSYVLDHQQQMNQILMQENARLRQKKIGVDDAITSQRRLIELNESYRKKSLQYINMLLVIIIVALIYLGLVLLRRNFPIIPKMVFNVSIAILFAVGMLLILSIASKINKRDEMNFDKLAFVPPPDTSGNVYTSGNVSSSSSYLASMNLGAYCMNGNCCSEGTLWNEEQLKCISIDLSAFTLLSEAYPVGNNQVKGLQTVPYFPSEYDYYSKL